MSDTTTLTLTEFLLARYAEEQAEAERGRSHPDPTTFARDDYGYLWVQPSHVLAECEAKRRIVEESRRPGETEPDFDAGWESALEFALQCLALPYADRPDYRQEWRP